MRRLLKKYMKEFYFLNKVLNFILRKNIDFDQEVAQRIKLFRRINPFMKFLKDNNTSDICFINNEIYLKTYDDFFLYYNTFDEKYTLGDGQALDFRVRNKNSYFENFVLKHFTEDFIFFDVGTNNGYFYSMKFAKKIQNSTIYSFEPDKKILKHLEKNLLINKIKNVNVIKKAVGDSNGRITITSNLGASNYIVNDNTHERTTEIPITTFDTFIKEEAVDRIDLIKVDIEGAEMSFLKGAEKSIDSFRPLIAIELIEEHLKRFDTSLKDVMNKIENFNYKIFHIINSNDFIAIPNEHIEIYLEDLKKFTIEIK